MLRKLYWKLYLLIQSCAILIMRSSGYVLIRPTVTPRSCTMKQISWIIAMRFYDHTSTNTWLGQNDIKCDSLFRLISTRYILQGNSMVHASVTREIFKSPAHTTHTPVKMVWLRSTIVNELSPDLTHEIKG